MELFSDNVTQHLMRFPIDLAARTAAHPALPELPVVPVGLWSLTE